MAVEKRDPVANKVHILLADLADGISSRFVDGNPWAATPLWSPNGDRVISTDFSRSYLITSVRDDEDVQTVEYAGTGAGGWLMDWSADGQYVIFQGNRHHDTQ